MHPLCPTNVIVIGSSADGIPAVSTLLNKFTDDLPSPWEIRDHDLVRYRCPWGTGSTAAAFAMAWTRSWKAFLFSVLRAIEEAIELRTRMMAQAKNRQLTEFTATLDWESAEMKGRAKGMRELLIGPIPQNRQRHAGRRKRRAHG